MYVTSMGTLEVNGVIWSQILKKSFVRCMRIWEDNIEMALNTQHIEVSDELNWLRLGSSGIVSLTRR